MLSSAHVPLRSHPNRHDARHLAMWSPGTHLDNLETLILDEADRLLELGFTDEVDQIVRACPGGRQTLLFSATFNAGERSVRSFVTTPVPKWGCLGGEGKGRHISECCAPHPPPTPSYSDSGQAA